MPYDDDHPRDGATTVSEARPSERAPQQGRGDATSDRQPDDRTSPAKKRRSPLMWIILGMVLIAAVAGGVFWWLSTRNLESTDDANTDGRAVMISPQVSGYVSALLITDNQFVKKGDVLLRITQRDYQASRDQAAGQLAAAQGQLNSARANLALAHVTYPAKLAAAQAQLQSNQAKLTQAQADARRQNAISRAATSQQNIDVANAGLKQAEAAVADAQASVQQASPVNDYIAQAEAQVKQLEGQVETAQGQLVHADINLGYTNVVAPQDGWVTKRNVEQGNYVTPGNSLMALVSPQVWVTANFKESQLNRMRPGQAVAIAVDAYPSLKLRGHVDSVQLGSGSRFTAFPAENATGNFVKIVQRVPVKIDIDSGLDPNMPLPLGISVTPTVSLK